MSAIHDYQNSLIHDRILATALIGGLYLHAINQDSLPGGEAELELVREQLEIVKRFRELQEQRIELTAEYVAMILSGQQQEAA
ncbi:hypothetical protein SH449x_000779 [Pirellulaceae bacterium SH449]